MTYRHFALSVSHTKVGLYLLYVILFENFKLKIHLILQKATFSKHRPSGPMLSISLFVRPSVRLYACPPVRLSVCLFTFEVPFNGLFSPTSQSRMSNIFRDSESLVEKNGKMWSQIRTFLFENCLKLPCKKKFFSSLFLFFFGFRSFLTVFLPPLLEVGCPIFLEIRNPWEKVMERSGLTFQHFCLEVV